MGRGDKGCASQQLVQGWGYGDGFAAGRAGRIGSGASDRTGDGAGTGGLRVGGAAISVRDRRLWMDVAIAGRGPFPFIVDTGTFANLIRSDLARELGLSPSGRLAIAGVGGRERWPIFRAPSVLLGGVDIGLSEFAAYDQEILPIHPMARGALSSLLLTTVDADLDFDRGQWRVYPDGRGAAAGYAPIPSRIGEQVRGRGSPKISVDVEIDGRPFKLHVDTGAPGQLSLWGGAPARTGLWNDNAPYSPIRVGGIGGAGSRGRLVRGREVRLGHIRFERPLISLVQGGHRGDDADGLIGIQLLQQMNIGTDMRARQLLAMRNRRAAPPERYGMSGMWIDERGDRLVVSDVSPQSPAAEAGLRVEDEIVGEQLRPLLARLGGRPGDVVPINYRRGGTSSTAQLTLRPYL